MFDDPLTVAVNCSIAAAVRCRSEAVRSVRVDRSRLPLAISEAAFLTVSAVLRARVMAPRTVLSTDNSRSPAAVRACAARLVKSTLPCKADSPEVMLSSSAAR